MFIDCLLDAAIDTAKLIPFLFITYLLMEYLEEKSEDAFADKIRKAGKVGPLWGSLLGVVPQCGFSAAAASLFAGGIITAGTVFAVFLSTSDEMLPIFISSAVDIKVIVTVLVMKVVMGACSGFAFSFIFRKFEEVHANHSAIHNICEAEDCKCEEDGNIFKAAFVHTIKIAIYILIISFVLNLIVEGIGDDNIRVFMSAVPLLSVFVSALVGLIPNCGASVAIASLYIAGVIPAQAMMAGLLTSAGVGLLILFRLNKNIKENLIMLGMLYFFGVFWGIISGFLPWL